MTTRKRLGKIETQFVVWLTYLALFVLIGQPLTLHSAVIEQKETGKDSPRGPEFNYVPGEVLVKFKQNVLPREKEQFHAEANAEVLSTLPRIGVHRVKGKSGESTEALLNRYRKNPFVEYAEPNILFRIQLTPNDPRFNELYGLHNIGQSGGTVDADVDAPEAWDLQTGSNTIVVADIDTGVDYNHPDLAANMWTNPGEIAGNGLDDDNNGKIDDVRGWDFVNNDNDPMDDHGHGTHTSGTIAAVGNNSVGIVGVAWQAKIMALKFLDANGTGSLSTAAAAIIYAADEGAKISSNSWGCGPNSGCFSQTLEDAIAYANTRGMLFIVAAGNNNGNDNDDTIFYPCTANQPNVICVAATDRNDQRASFSNFGATTVDLGAPGVETLSTVPTSGAVCCSDPSGYRSLNGTSMATPHVAGAAVLLMAQFPTSTLDQIKTRILSNVDPIAALSGITVTGGRLNVDRALRAANPPAAPTNLLAADVPADSGGAVALSWSPSTSAAVTQQRLYRSTTSGGPYSLIVTFSNNTTNSYTDTGLTDGIRYFYVMRAFNGVESGNSNEANVIPVNNTDATPPVISNVAASNITSSTATITWTTNEVADSQVEYGTTTSYGSASPLDTTAITSHSVTISGLSSSTLYHYRVKSRDLAGNLTISSDFTFTTAPFATNAWSSKAFLPSVRQYLAAGVIDGILYAVGGYIGGASAIVEAYNPATNTWSPKASMPTARESLAVGVVNGKLYAIGGIDTNRNVVTTVEEYNPVSNSWSTKAPLPAPRSNLAVGAVNGKLYAIGGAGPFGTVYEYDPVADSWTTKAGMPTPRQDLAVGVIDGKLYAVGGTADRTNGSALMANEEYDPETNTWITKAPLPTARHSLAAGVVNGLLYVVAGRQGQTNFATNEAYDPVTDTWMPKAPAPTARYGLAAGAINGSLYVTGGIYTFFADATEAYDASTEPTLTLTKPGFGSGIVTSSPGGINCGSTCSASFISGTSVTLTATPDPGSAVNGFSGGCTSTTTTCTFTISANTAVAAVFNDIQSPTAPSNLTATAANSTQIGLSWAASTDNTKVSGYWIERCQGSGCSNFARINTSLIISLGYSDTGLTPGTSYSYRVQAADAEGNLSAYSNVATASTPGTQVTLTLTKAGSGTGTVTSSPGGINCGATCSASFASGTSVTLTATADTGSSAVGFSGGCTSATTTCTFTLSANTTVTATFNDTQAPTAPSSLTATAVSGSQINLSWTASTDNIGVSGYWIERCQGAGCSNFARINPSLVTATNYSDTGLTAGTSYSYRVQAADAAGNLSGYSNTASAVPTTPLNGKILYSIAANTTPRTRDYTDATNTFSAAATTVAGSTAIRTVLRASPTKNEMIAGYVNSSGVLQVMCYNGTAWTNEWTVTVGGTGSTRRFDISYETNSGDVIVLYSRNVGTPNELGYRTKPGSAACGAANWSAVTNFDPTVTSGVVHWVKLAWDRRGTSNLITAIWADAASDLGAAVWSGTAWGNQRQLETTLQVVTAAQDVENFDVEYESLSGDVMAVWGRSVAAGANGVRYATCTGGTATCTWSAVLTPPTWLDDATHLDLSANPNTDEMVFGSIGKGQSDLQVGYWSGSAWTNTANLDTTATLPTAGTKFVAAGWLINGSTTRSIITYYDSGATNIGWVVGNGGVFTLQTDFTPTPALATQRQYDIQTDPINKDRLMFTVSNSSSDIFAKRLVMSSTGTFTWSNADGGAALELNTASTTYKTFDFAYNRYTGP